MLIDVVRKGAGVQILKATPRELELIKANFCRKIKGWQYDPRVKRKLWDGVECVINDANEIPIGLWVELLKSAENAQIEVKIKDKSKLPVNKKIKKEDVENFCRSFFQYHKNSKGEPFYPFDFQIESVYKILRHKYCTISVGTGGGKSLISSILIFYYMAHNPNSKFLIVVPKTSLVKQFYDDLIDHNYGFNKENETPLDFEIQEIISAGNKPRGKKIENPDVYISTWNSLLKKEKEFLEMIDVIIIDEAHEAVDSLSNCIPKSFKTSAIRIGMSGTLPEEKSLRWLKLQGYTGPKVMEVTTQQLIEIGRTSPAEVRILMLNHNDHEFHESVTKLRKMKMGTVAYNKEKTYLQESVPRMNFLVDLVSRLDKSSIILFNNEVYGLSIKERLEEEFGDKKNIWFANGNKDIVSLKERVEIEKEMDFRDDEENVLIASFGIFSTGVSINNIHNVIFADNYKSFTRIVQSIGRGVRLHDKKSKVMIWDLADVFIGDLNELKDNSNIYYTQMIERQKIYRKEGRPYKTNKIELENYNYGLNEKKES